MLFFVYNSVITQFLFITFGGNVINIYESRRPELSWSWALLSVCPICFCKFTKNIYFYLGTAVIIIYFRIKNFLVRKILKEIGKYKRAPCVYRRFFTFSCLNTHLRGTLNFFFPNIFLLRVIGRNLVIYSIAFDIYYWCCPYACVWLLKNFTIFLYYYKNLRVYIFLYPYKKFCEHIFFNFDSDLLFMLILVCMLSIYTILKKF